MSELVILPTGIANTASVSAAFSRLGANPIVSDDPGLVDAAEYLVVPGVGAFGAAMAAIDRIGVRSRLIERFNSGRATLAICVGMQVLARASSESPGAEGLGLIAANVARFDGETKTPQLGWNTVSPRSDSLYLEPGWAYFANSYRLTTTPEGWSAATTDHGGSFVSAMERGGLLACQFHPELSGAWGEQVLSRWLSNSRGLS